MPRKNREKPTLRDGRTIRKNYDRTKLARRADRAQRKIGKAANGERIELGTSRELSGPIRPENTANTVLNKKHEPGRDLSGKRRN